MKKIFLMILIAFSLSLSADESKEFAIYKYKVIDYSKQVLVQYSVNIHDGIYATKKEQLTYLKVCIVLKYDKLIEQGYKKKTKPLKVVQKIFKTGLKRCY